MHGFSRHERLLKRAEFLSVSDHGEKFYSRNFILLRKPTADRRLRLGITVSRKVGNAVTRNRVKRLVREFFRLHKDLFTPADYNVIARQGAARLAFNELCRELGRVLQHTP